MLVALLLSGLSVAHSDAPLSFLQKAADLHFDDEKWEDDDDADFDPEMSEGRRKQLDTLSDVLDRGDTYEFHDARFRLEKIAKSLRAALQKLLSMVENNAPADVLTGTASGSQPRASAVAPKRNATDLSSHEAIDHGMDDDDEDTLDDAPYNDLENALVDVVDNESKKKPKSGPSDASDHDVGRRRARTTAQGEGVMGKKDVVAKVAKTNTAAATDTIPVAKKGDKTIATARVAPHEEVLPRKSTSQSSSLPHPPQVLEDKRSSMPREVVEAKLKSSTPSSEPVREKSAPSMKSVVEAKIKSLNVMSPYEAAQASTDAGAKKGGVISQDKPNDLKAVISQVNHLKSDLESLAEKEARARQDAAARERELTSVLREKQQADAANESLRREEQGLTTKLMTSQEKQKLEEAEILALKEKDRKDIAAAKAREQMIQGEVEGLHNDLYFQKREEEVRKKAYEKEVEKLEREVDWMKNQEKTSHGHLMDLKNKLSEMRAKYRAASKTIKRLRYLRHLVDEESKKQLMVRRERMREAHHREQPHFQGIRSNDEDFSNYVMPGHELDDE